MIRMLAVAAAMFVTHAAVADPLRVAQADGASTTLGPLRIAEAFARPAAAPGGASAAYMTIGTTGAPDRLIAAATPAAARAELHDHVLGEDGVARMRPVESIAVSAEAPARLEPGGLHVMLMGLSTPLAEGESVSLTLTFETAGEVELTVPVRQPAAHGGHGG